MNNKRGYYGIGIYLPKYEINVGGLFRTAHSFGADFVFTVGRRYKPQASDTTKVMRHVPLYNYQTFDDCVEHLPMGCELVCVELTDDAEHLTTFQHPQRCVYLLGAEDHGLPPRLTNKFKTIQVPFGKMCLNVATTGGIVMYDRKAKSTTHEG